MPFQIKLLSLVLLLSLSACSNKPERNKAAHELFTTDIRSDGSKRFVFTMVYAIAENSRGQSEGKRADKKREGRGPQGQDDGSRRQADTKRDSQQGSLSADMRDDVNDNERKAIIELLDIKLTETEYCRHGYIELNFSQMRDKTELAGECQESASPDDKRRWK